MKVLSYNINGIRAVIKKGFIDWLKKENPDIICLQEIKAFKSQFDYTLIENLGYNIYWNSAEKKGYSGVAILSKIKANNISYGIGFSKYDLEGRFIRADFNKFSLCSIYFPSGTSGSIRQKYKMEFLNKIYNYFKNDNKSIIVCGDFNICHFPIDIHDPIRNKKSSGFLPEEREWMSQFINLGFIDIFRKNNSSPHNYTWWSYRALAKQRNKGWRIDYFMISSDLEKRVSCSSILSDINFSDHCPISLVLQNKN
ncbi:MAG: exodeoxyribonuclease III [Flavobacteriales bacterium TMED113]|nr:MAG: exodeoxyribonuclease III [Flavobacteriales bacterium TMED113]